MPYSGFIRRLSHSGEYAVLTLLVYRAFAARVYEARVPRPGSTRWRAPGLAFAVSVAYAVTDELHQSVVPGRECSLLDLAYDALGAARGAALGRLITRAVRDTDLHG